MKPIFTALFIGMTICAIPTTAQAADFDAKARANAVAPFVDDQSIVIAHLELAAFNPQVVLNRLSERLGLPAVLLPSIQRSWKQSAEALSKTGAKEAYVVVSLADVPEGPPLVAIPVPQGADAAAILSVLRAIPTWQQDSAPPPGGVSPFEAVEQVSGSVAAGSRAALDRLKAVKTKRVERPELAAAFEAAGDTSAQVLIVPSPEVRKVFEQLVPQLPNEVGGGPGSIVTRGARWIAIGIDSPSNPMAARIVVQSQDPQAAKALDRLIDRIKERLASHPLWGRLATMLITPTIETDRLTLKLTEEQISSQAFLAPVAAAVEAGRRAQSVNNLKQLGLALHNYHDAYKRFPTSASYDDQGRPLLSWRVAILPFIEQDALYKEFHLNEPWDSEHNRALIPRMPRVYRDPYETVREPGKTRILAPVGVGLAFEGRQGITFREFLDGTSNTILLVEADPQRAVEWTRPEDLAVDLDDPWRNLKAAAQSRLSVLITDASVRALSYEVPPQTMKKLFTRAGDEPIDSKELER